MQEFEERVQRQRPLIVEEVEALEPALAFSGLEVEKDVEGWIEAYIDTSVGRERLLHMMNQILMRYGMLSPDIIDAYMSGEFYVKGFGD